MNTPTQEQIKAALRYADGAMLPQDDKTLKDCGFGYNFIGVYKILAAAYREKCKELEAMKQPAQLPQPFPN